MSVNRDAGILKKFSELDGRTTEKMIAFGQEKSAKSQKISKVRSYDNPVLLCTWNTQKQMPALQP